MKGPLFLPSLILGMLVPVGVLFAASESGGKSWIGQTKEQSKVLLDADHPGALTATAKITKIVPEGIYLEGFARLFWAKLGVKVSRGNEEKAWADVKVGQTVRVNYDDPSWLVPNKKDLAYLLHSVEILAGD